MLPIEGMTETAGASRIAVLVPCYNEEAAIGKDCEDATGWFGHRR